VAHQAAVLTALHHDGPRAEGGDPPDRRHQVILAGEHARLAFVEQQDVHPGQDAGQRIGLALDPVVHRIEGDQGIPLHLVEDVVLQVGVDVAEKQVPDAPVVGMDLGFELGEDVQLGGQRVRLVQVAVVFARPEERLAAAALDLADIDPVVQEDSEMLIGEILADHRDDSDVGEEAGHQAEVGGGASHHPLRPAEGGRDTVERYGSDGEQGHGRPPMRLPGSRRW